MNSYLSSKTGINWSEELFINFPLLLHLHAATFISSKSTYEAGNIKYSNEVENDVYLKK